MTWLADETSVEDGAPREGYEIELPAVTYRIASGGVDVTIDGNLYRAFPLERADLPVPADGGAGGTAGELEFTLPVSHALPRRYLQEGIPPRTIKVTLRRQQARSGESERTFVGFVESMRVERHAAIFVATSKFSRAMQRRLPTVTVGRGCPHVLYDANCRVNMLDYAHLTTIGVADGTTITVASLGGEPDQWARYGMVVHVPSGERAEIVSQVGNTLEIDLPIVGAASGDVVLVTAGCAHDLTDCREKFGANQANYGGGPSTPQSNPMIPGKNLGIVTQT